MQKSPFGKSISTSLFASIYQANRKSCCLQNCMSCGSSKQSSLVFRCSLCKSVAVFLPIFRSQRSVCVLWCMLFNCRLWFFFSSCLLFPCCLINWNRKLVITNVGASIYGGGRVYFLIDMMPVACNLEKILYIHLLYTNRISIVLLVPTTDCVPRLLLVQQLHYVWEQMFHGFMKPIYQRH